MDVIDDRLEQLGADTEKAKAALLGVERSSLYRWRRGHAVSLDSAARVAIVVDLLVDDVINRNRRAA